MSNRKRKGTGPDWFTIVLHLLFICVCVCYIIPILLVISASFTSEEWLSTGKGIHLLPQEFSVEAYRSAFANRGRMVRAYMITISQAALGTFLSCLVASMAGYSLSRSNFRFKKIVVFIIFFTMLFHAGMIPNYIIYSKYYHINDNFLIYILPGITGGAWNTMVFRSFFRSISESLFESARLDGASEFKIFYRIVVPLSKPVFASIGFMTLVGKWNDYATSMIYIRNENLYTLQFLLQRLMKEAAFLKNLATEMPGSLLLQGARPSESLKFAMCVVAAGPMLFVFPFFQKYFVKGLTIGSVKE